MKCHKVTLHLHLTVWMDGFVFTERESQCSVCMEDFHLDDVVRSLPCQHLFHTDCINPWLHLVDRFMWNLLSTVCSTYFEELYNSSGGCIWHLFKLVFHSHSLALTTASSATLQFQIRKLEWLFWSCCSNPKSYPLGHGLSWINSSQVGCININWDACVLIRTAKEHFWSEILLRYIETVLKLFNFLVFGTAES